MLRLLSKLLPLIIHEVVDIVKEKRELNKLKKSAKNEISKIDN